MSDAHPRHKSKNGVAAHGAAAPPTGRGSTLELRKRLGLNQSIFARLLAISVRSLAAMENGGMPSEAVSRRVTELRRLVHALSEVMCTESIGTWLRTPNDAFNGLRPIEVIERGESDRIWSMTYFLRSGAAS